MRAILLLYILAMLTLVKGIFPNIELDPLSDEFISTINKNQSLWRAGRNFPIDTPLSYLRNLCGWRLSNAPEPPQIVHNLADLVIPEEFDWRDYFPTCTTLRDIRDQGNCGSCWAVATAEVISDRCCIYSKGKNNVYISDNDLLACCKGGGCDGGHPVYALNHWINKGIVSGGPYGSHEGCRPYEIPPCNPCPPPSRTPPCKKSCYDGYSKSYKEDLHFGTSSYTVEPNVRQIQAEIMKNGPVVAALTVYNDFFSYKSGVYQHAGPRDKPNHAVKIIGWGVEKETLYWIGANSWSTYWGDKGFFKISQGNCRIEDFVYAGLPDNETCSLSVT